MDKAYWQRYEKRVRAYEKQGMTRSDAQGVVDAEERTMPNTEKHTPGPWKVVGTEIWAGSRRITMGRGAYDVKDRNQRDANAALIARAPALLAQNKRLREALEEMVGVFSGTSESCGQDEAIEQARDALNETKEG